MYSIITLPEGFIADITTTIGTLFTDLGTYITLVVGVVLACLVIEIIVGVLRK